MTKYTDKILTAPQLSTLLETRPTFTSVQGEVGGERRFVLDKEWSFFYRGNDWVIDKGYTWNGANIPSLIGITWAITYSRYHPVVILPSLFHDYFCDLRDPRVGHKAAAELFAAMLIQEGAPPWKAETMKKAVLSPFGPKWGDK